MAKYVYLENNVVVDRVQVDPFNVFYPEYASLFIPAPDEVDHFWTYDGTTFHPPVVTDEMKWANIRQQRDYLLTQSDSYVFPDRWAAMTTAKQQEWTTYRQALRDIPQTFTNPDDVVWPTKPE